MTTPQQRALALEFAGQILVDLGTDLQRGMNKATRMEYLERVRHVLRHYPDSGSIRYGAAQTEHLASKQEKEPWVAPWPLWRKTDD